MVCKSYDVHRCLCLWMSDVYLILIGLDPGVFLFTVL